MAGFFSLLIDKDLYQAGLKRSIGSSMITALQKKRAGHLAKSVNSQRKLKNYWKLKTSISSVKN